MASISLSKYSIVLTDIYNGLDFFHRKDRKKCQQVQRDFFDFFHDILKVTLSHYIFNSSPFGHVRTCNMPKSLCHVTNLSVIKTITIALQTNVADCVGRLRGMITDLSATRDQPSQFSPFPIFFLSPSRASSPLSALTSPNPIVALRSDKARHTMRTHATQSTNTVSHAKSEGNRGSFDHAKIRDVSDRILLPV